MFTPRQLCCAGARCPRGPICRIVFILCAGDSPSAINIYGAATAVIRSLRLRNRSIPEWWLISLTALWSALLPALPMLLRIVDLVAFIELFRWRRYISVAPFSEDEIVHVEILICNALTPWWVVSLHRGSSSPSATWL